MLLFFVGKLTMLLYELGFCPFLLQTELVEWFLFGIKEDPPFIKIGKIADILHSCVNQGGSFSCMLVIKFVLKLVAHSSIYLIFIFTSVLSYRWSN